MILTISDPLKEPMIHKDFPGGPQELQEYVMEVCEGIKDHLVRNPEDPEDTRWEYTYHQRMFAYDVAGFNPFDQIETMCQKLAEVPYTRRAQAVTWKVWEDNDCYDPPCLQSLWGRITEENGKQFLDLNARFRSNDAYRAAFHEYVRSGSIAEKDCGTGLGYFRPNVHCLPGKKPAKDNWSTRP